MGGCPSGGGKKHEVQRAPKSDSSIPRKDFYRAKIFTPYRFPVQYTETQVHLGEECWTLF
jgi:hypothetical protein